MPKGPQGQKQPPKSKNLPRKLPEDPVSHAVAIMREATGENRTSTGALGKKPA
jgi:hypothetical protein